MSASLTQAEPPRGPLDLSCRPNVEAACAARMPETNARGELKLIMAEDYGARKSGHHEGWGGAGELEIAEPDLR